METYSSADMEKKRAVKQLGLQLDDSVNPVDHVAGTGMTTRLDPFCMSARPFWQTTLALGL